MLFFCKSFERFGYVSFEHLKYIEASADPKLSDFHISDERWEFREEDERHGGRLRSRLQAQILRAAADRPRGHEAAG